MPLHKTINHNTTTTIKIWKITETLNQLLSQTQLKPSSLNRLNGMKSSLHQCGFTSVRCLLNSFGYTDEDLQYNTNGKPYLSDGKYISITHSFTYSAIIISTKPVGIDIEKQRDKIKRIATKFIEYEANYLTDDDTYVKKLTLIWCIKESLYKLYATKGLSFKQHTLVIPFNIKDCKTRAWVDYNKNKTAYEATFLDLDGFSCAYVI